MIDNKYRRKEVIDAPYIPKVIIIYNLHLACQIITNVSIQ